MSEETDCLEDTDELSDEIASVCASDVETDVSGWVCRDVAGVVATGSDDGEFVQISMIPATAIKHSNKISALRSPFEK